MQMKPIETMAVRLEPVPLVTVQAPIEDVERILTHVQAIAPLAVGKYDRNSYQTAPGIERYRPLQGAAAGPEIETRERPGVIELSFQLPNDSATVEQVIEAIFQVHSYQEPFITVQQVLASRSRGLDDSANPHRWWNTTGDWKTAGDRKTAGQS